MIGVILGTLAVAGCVWLCATSVSSYARHMDSGDQAGFALGMLLLTAWYIPVAGTLLTAGVLWLAREKHGAATRWTVAAFLALGSIAMLVLAGFVLSLTVRSNLARRDHPFAPEMSSAFAPWACLLTLLAFPVFGFACAVMVRQAGPRPPGGGPPWFAAILFATAVIAMLQIAAFSLVGMGPGLLIMGMPGVIWIATLLFAARRLRGREDHGTGTAPTAP